MNQNFLSRPTKTSDSGDWVQINPHLLSTFDTFWAKGYEAWTATKPSRPVNREEIERIAAGAANTLPTDNFLFHETGKRARFFGD